jgi:hypothetical protein
MDMTKKLKLRIDKMTFKEMLSMWRYAPMGSRIFMGESFKYFTYKMMALSKNNKL